MAIYSYLTGDWRVAKRRDELRQCAKVVSATQKALVVANSQARLGAKLLDELSTRIGEIESRVALALEQGREEDAFDMAALAAQLTTEHAAIADRTAGIAVESVILKKQIAVFEPCLHSLKRSLQVNVGQVLVCDPEALLARLRSGQSRMKALKAVLDRVGSVADPARLLIALKKVCCGAPLKISADAVLARLNAKAAFAA